MNPKKYFVAYEVRNHGAIGIFWKKTDYILANSVAEAQQAFRDKWQKEFEFRFPYQCVEVPTLS